MVFLHGRKKVRRGNNRCFCSCRIVSSLRSRMILPSVLFTREMSGWEDVATAARDGSSLSTERSAVVPCLLTQYCGSEIKRKTTTDPGSLRATVTTYTRANPSRNQYWKLCRIWKLQWCHRLEFSVPFDH